MVQHTALTSIPWDVSGESDVPLLTPTSTPRVPDPVEGLTSLSAISHDGNGVVAALSALLILVDTSFVELEIGLDTDSDDVLSGGSHHLAVIVLGNGTVGFDPLMLPLARLLAFTGPCVSVRIVLLISGTIAILFLEIPCGGHPATVAATSIVDAVHELLLGVDR